MLYNPYFDFLTLHVYPFNWEVCVPQEPRPVELWLPHDTLKLST